MEVKVCEVVIQLGSTHTRSTLKVRAPRTHPCLLPLLSLLYFINVWVLSLQWLWRSLGLKMGIELLMVKGVIIVVAVTYDVHDVIVQQTMKGYQLETQNGNRKLCLLFEGLQSQNFLSPSLGFLIPWEILNFRIRHCQTQGFKIVNLKFSLNSKSWLQLHTLSLRQHINNYS